MNPGLAFNNEAAMEPHHYKAGVVAWRPAGRCWSIQSENVGEDKKPVIRSIHGKPR